MSSFGKSFTLLVVWILSYFHSECLSTWMFVICFDLLFRHVEAINNYETYICHLETVYSPPHEFSHFLEHPLLTPLPYQLGFYCFDKPLLVTDTHYCITLEVHFNTYSESIEHLDNRTIPDLSHGLRWLHLKVWFGTILNKGTEARGLDCELTFLHPHFLVYF